jgi:hypothetical protein
MFFDTAGRNKIKNKKMAASLKVPFTIPDPYTRTHQGLFKYTMHFQADLIWCDGTFKANTHNFI